MAFEMYYLEPGGSAYTQLDLSADKIRKIKLSVGYSHPSQLTWEMAVAQHSIPIPERSNIILGDTDFNTPTNTKPIFEGHVASVLPLESNKVSYIAFDPTYRAAQEIIVMSGPHGFSNITARSVFNAPDVDDDIAFNQTTNPADVQTIIQIVMANAYAELVAMQAAPPLTVGGPAYVTGDLSGLDFTPQEKVVFETEGMRSAIDRMLAVYPRIKIHFEPGAGATNGRKWRFRDVLAAPQVTLHLNDPTQTYPVLSMELNRSLEGRATAVKVFGPEKPVFFTPSVAGGDLTELWDSGEATAFEAGGPGAVGTGNAGKKWQVTDPDQRRLARRTPDEFYAPRVSIRDGNTIINQYWVETREPELIASWDMGVTWEPVNAIRLDIRNGIITAVGHVYHEEDDGMGGTIYKLPDDVTYLGAYLTTPDTARFPASGYSGTAYDDASMEVEKRYYDEAMAIGYEYGVPVTSAARVAQFTKLATEIQKALRDIVFAGGCVLSGIDYQFLRLNRRINFTVHDGEGGTIAAGWDGLNAILTDVEYDFAERTTTLTFSSDHMEFLQTDPEALKQLLKIRPLQQIAYQHTDYNFGIGRISATTRSGFIYRNISRNQR